MSATSLSTRPLVPRAMRWDEVEPGFRVATRDGEHLGFIESTARGTFVAVDGSSTPVGRYDTLREAQRALRQVERLGRRGVSRTLRQSPVGLRRHRVSSPPV